jgi:hypothetical protein
MGGNEHSCFGVNAPQHFSRTVPYWNFDFSSRAPSEAGKPQSANECMLVGEVSVYVFYENEYKRHAFMIFHG